MSKAKILIVEDDSLSATILQRRLETLDYVVIGPAASGPEALELAREHQPSLVLMDIMIDGPFDGLDTAIRMRAVHDVPIIFLTAHSDPATLDRVKTALPYGYLIKPFEPRELQTAIEVALGRHQAEAMRLIYERAITTSSSGMIVCDARRPHAPIIEVSPRFEVITGYKAAEVIGRSCSFLQGIATDPVQIALMREAIHRGEERRVTLLNYRKDGTTFWNEVTIYPVRSANGQLTHFVGQQEDVTERVRGEEAVRHSQVMLQRANTAFETLLRSTAAAVGVDFFPTVVRELCTLLHVGHVYVSEIIPWDIGFARTLAYCRGGVLAENFEYELRGTPCQDAQQAGPLFIHEKAHTLYPDDQTELMATAECCYLIPLYSNRREVIGFFVVVDQKPATFDPLSRSLISVFAIRVEAELQRLHAEEDRHRIETQFFQAQKMDALGTLAGGVAHDFNNILTGILNYAELAKMSVPENAEAIAYIDEVTNAGRRARDLVSQILEFSRNELRAPQPMHLDTVVREAHRLLRSTLPASIDLVLRLSDQAPLVLADPSQMHQVLMNLCLNASQAIREKTGRIEIALEPFPSDRKFMHEHPGFPPGIALRLSVTDTGPGMDQRTLSRIFEPFFTTKAPGEGTGLGLPVVHGIVKNHRGVIQVFSQPGEGVTVHIYLPAYDSALDSQLDDVGSKSGTALSAGGQARILLVDDEVGVADSTRLMLENLGFRVSMHCDSTQAFEVFARQPDDYDLVLTDYLMPRMNGVVLAGKILALRPQLPILMTSGFVANWSAEKMREYGIRELVPKPTSVSDLAAIINRTLHISV